MECYVSAFIAYIFGLIVGYNCTSWLGIVACSGGFLLGMGIYLLINEKKGD